MEDELIKLIEAHNDNPENASNPITRHEIINHIDEVLRNMVRNKVLTCGKTINSVYFKKKFDK